MLALAVKRLPEGRQLGLARYDAMCTAIAECHRVDEVKEYRDKARALEVYAQQAMNIEAERRAAEVRIRAERRAGELMIEMKETGQMRKPEAGRPAKAFRDGTLSGATERTLSSMGISRKQSMNWQQLAKIPQETFESDLKRTTGVPNTEGMINAQLLRENPTPHIAKETIQVWGALKDFERYDFFHMDPDDLLKDMTSPMRDDVTRLAPRIIHWLSTFEK